MRKKSQWLNDITAAQNIMEKRQIGARKQRRYENGSLFLIVFLFGLCHSLH